VKLIAICKGSRHPAKLNLGDCFAYALAKETGEPLLYKGDDFSRTDINLGSKVMRLFDTALGQAPVFLQVSRGNWPTIPALCGELPQVVCHPSGRKTEGLPVCGSPPGPGTNRPSRVSC
jgi:hypothetical protein